MLTCMTSSLGRSCYPRGLEGALQSAVAHAHFRGHPSGTSSCRFAAEVRYGEALASSRLSFKCSVIPREARDSIGESCREVAPILDRTLHDLARREDALVGTANRLEIDRDPMSLL